MQYQSKRHLWMPTKIIVDIQIDRYELKDVLCKMAKDLKLPMVTDDDVNRYLAKLDIDGNGVITIDEFGKLFQEMIATKRSKTI